MYLVYKYRGKGESNGNHATMLNKGSKPTFNAKHSVNLGSSFSNNANCYNYTDRQDETECESLLEKDIQVGNSPELQYDTCTLPIQSRYDIDSSLKLKKYTRFKAL